MHIILFLTLLGVFIWSFYEPKVPEIIPALVYLVMVFVRINEKYHNYVDWLELNKKEEKRKLSYEKAKAAHKGFGRSTHLDKILQVVKDEYEYERKVRKRKLSVDIANAFLLKD